MKLYQKISLGIIFSGIAGFASVFAAGIDHFQVELSPESNQVGEYMDLSIEAVDKNNNIIPGYNGTIIIFSETDPEAILPSALKDNTYQFQTSDQGKVIFENSVSFKAEGKQEISIYDLTDDTVTGIGQASITKAEIVTNADISLLSPETGTTIGDNSINVSGSTLKNHAIVITLNGTTEYTTTSNSDGLFELEIIDLPDGENTLSAKILNSDKETIGTSDTSALKVDINKLSLKNIKLDPLSAESESEVQVTILSNPGLKEVTVIMNDILYTLLETSDGAYSGSIFAPKDAGDYTLDVVLKNDIGHDLKELGAASLNVVMLELEAASPKKVLDAKTKDLDIKNLKLIPLKTKSVLTWDAITDVEGYNVYKKDENGTLELIQKVSDPEIEIAITGKELKYSHFAVKAIAKNDSGILYEGNLSDATKIQTGPELLILLLISLLIGAVFLFIRNTKKS